MNVELTRQGSRLVARTPFALAEVCAALPGAVWAKSERVWTYPATAGTAARVLRTFEHHRATVRADEPVVELVERWDNGKAHGYLRTADNLPPNRDDEPYESWQHQRRAFRYALEQDAAMLAMAMGTGKSKVTVDLLDAWNADTTLIVCPKNVVGVWPREFRRHGARDVFVTAGYPYKRNGAIKKSASLAERVEYLDDLWTQALLGREGDEHLVIVVNYESLWREPFKSWALERRWAAIVCDEIHRAKKPGGKASKMLASLRDRADRRLGLTGTFMPHSPLDVYAQYRFLEPALYGTSYSAFKQRYGKPRVLRYETDVNGEGEIVRTPVYLTDPTGNLIMDGVRDEVKQELADRLSWVTVECPDDVLDLPEPVDTDRPVELDAKAMGAYRDLEEHLVAEVDEGVVTVDNALTKLLRLQQVTSGHLPVEDDDGFEHTAIVGDEKEDALFELLTDVADDAPVIVFCRFRHDLDAVQRVAEKLGRRYGELSGKRRDALSADAELADGIIIAGVQIQSGGVGIDFTAARYGVYYSLGFSLTDYEQSRARLRRPGADTHKPVEFVHLVAEGTVDEAVYAALAERKRVVESVLGWLREKVSQGAFV